MASIVRYRDGWRAYVYDQQGKRKTKTARLKSEVEQWAKDMEGGSNRLSFALVAERFLKLKLPSLTNANNQRTYEQSIRDHVLPVIGHLKLGDIRRQTLVELVAGVADGGKVETAHRLGQRIRAIFDYAVDCGEIESHPAAGLSRVLPAGTKRRMAAVTPADVPGLLRAINGYPEPVTRIGLLLLAHTFVRTSELIGARWDELKGNYWVIPEERMKRRLPHVVPISAVVRNLLDELQPMTGDSQYILASRTSLYSPISNNTMLFALYRLGYRGRMTGHGFRAVASSILNESGLWSADAVERQLAHKETDKVRASYHRAEYLPERVRMMEWYSAHLLAMASSTAE